MCVLLEEGHGHAGQNMQAHGLQAWVHQLLQQGNSDRSSLHICFLCFSCELLNAKPVFLLRKHALVPRPGSIGTSFR